MAASKKQHRVDEYAEQKRVDEYARTEQTRVDEYSEGEEKRLETKAQCSSRIIKQHTPVNVWRGRVRAIKPPGNHLRRQPRGRSAG